jgi:tetratricopeptide (TPR) repeat protein
MLSIANDHLSIPLRALGELDSALKYNRTALQIRSELTAEFPLNADYQRALYVAHSTDGAILTMLGPTAESLISYEKSLSIIEKLLDADPKNEQYRSDCGYTLLRIGDTLVLLDNLTRALSRYRAAIAIRSAETDSDPSSLFKRMPLIEARAKLAKTLAKRQEFAAAMAESDATLALLD